MKGRVQIQTPNPLSIVITLKKAPILWLILCPHPMALQGKIRFGSPLPLSPYKCKILLPSWEERKVLLLCFSDKLWPLNQRRIPPKDEANVEHFTSLCSALALDINPGYQTLALTRIAQDSPMLPSLGSQAGWPWLVFGWKTSEEYQDHNIEASNGNISYLKRPREVTIRQW